MVTALNTSRSLAACLLGLLLVVPGTAKAAIDPTLTVDKKTQTIVYLTDGSMIVGAITGIRDDALSVATAFSDDDLTIDVALIDSTEWLQEVELLLDDDRVVVLPALRVENGELDMGVNDIELADVDIMNPEDWERGEGYNWKGDTGAALAINRGNTETDEVDLTLNTVFESARDRYTFNGSIDRDNAYNLTDVDGEQVRQKVVTADKWAVLGKYDYFLEDSRNYIGFNANVDADALAGVDLRTYAGPYFGRKLVDSDDLKLDGEIGAAFVSTEYAEDVDQEDIEYTGVNWNLTGESGILGGDSRIYFRHVGIMDMSDTDQLILRNTAGLAFPLVFGLEGAAEISIDYDGTAAADREEVDQVYSFRVGYSW